LAVVLKQINDPLPLPSTVKPDIPSGIEQVLLKALAKNPADRFASASDFIAAWKQALSGADTLRSQAEGPTPAATVEVTPARPTQPELSPGLKPDSTRGLSRDMLLVGGLLGGLAICLCLAIGLGLGAFSSLGGIFRPSASGAGPAATGTPEAVSTAGEVRTETPGEATAPTTVSGTPADRFTITIGDEVLENAPGQGAGDIENPGGQDIYTFTADPGQTVYFQINQTTDPQIKWQAVDEVGSVLFDTCLGCGDPGVKVLEHGGTYTLVVGAEAATETGAYHFKVWNVAPPDQFEIAIGAKVSQDALGPGAGNIENPGVKDLYTFTATPGQTVYFQLTRPPSGGDLIKWRLMDETDSVIFDTCLQCGDPGVKVLEHGGTYSVMVGNDSGAATGTYDFKIWDVPPPDQFTVVVGDEVSKETGQGAGYIETPGVKDIYSFTATPGQTVYFQITQPPSGSDLIKWRLMDETETVLFDTCLQCGDPGTQTLERGGTYTIIVGNDTGPATGTYQFKVWEVPPPDQFTITIGDEIAKDSPGQGAGDIESPGAKDIYTFTATPGQQVDFRVTQPPGTSASLKWQVVDELNNVVFDTCLQCGNPGVTTLERGGTYTIVVGNDSGAATGSYGFQIAAP